VDDRLGDPIRLASLLDPVGRKLGVGPAAEVGRLWAGWEEIVGPAVACHAEPTSFRDGVLRVRADSPVWATEITYLAETIRHSANGWLGKELVADVRVWTGPVKGLSRRVGKGAGAPPPAPRQRPSEELRGDSHDDPLVALDRAREAWSRRAGRLRGPPDEPGQSGKSPW
jgi:hypothetical protein